MRVISKDTISVSVTGFFLSNRLKAFAHTPFKRAS